MYTLHINDIRKFADSKAIFSRGTTLQKIGAYRKIEENSSENRYLFEVDGNYGNYQTEITLNDGIRAQCDCPYPGYGCKHVVAILLELYNQQNEPIDTPSDTYEDEPPHALLYLTPEEIKALALEDRDRRGRSEEFALIKGDMLKGDHLVTTKKGKQYQVTLHDPAIPQGHCSCPDYLSNKLGTCKHLFFAGNFLAKQKGFSTQLNKQHFPYIDIYWDSASAAPRLFHEYTNLEPELQALLEELFNSDGVFIKKSPLELIAYLNRLESYKRVRVQESVISKLDSMALADELEKVAATGETIDFSTYLKVAPYQYQKEGMLFGLYKKAVLIGDEMGLGKTLQAIGLGVAKSELFGFRTVLVVTMSSLKEQWKREIERFSHQQACVIAGSAQQRKLQYRENDSLFKITNYEAVLRDVTIIGHLQPDLIILDEAQRIKNFETKTAQAIKSLPRQHAIILTGTPLENKLEDVYSLVQFLDPELLSPLWQFAADHFFLNRNKKGDILGYTNLKSLQEKLKPLVIRRRKEEVIDQLPEVVVNDYYIDLHAEQGEIHAGLSQALLPIISKPFLTPVDMRRIQALLLKMRQVCDTTYLIDRETNISPKLDELGNIIDEILQQQDRKAVIFSEWTTMTMLIGKELSRRAIPFVELSGKVPVPKRQPLIDEFSTNPKCKVFLSTDAGGTGLNLQAADCVINFELPWNPAKLHQRIGRVNRIGQQAQSINVINLIAKDSIEERIMAGIKLKGDLFNGVFDDGQDEVLLTQKSKQEMVEQLRQMIGEEKKPIVESQPPEELPEDTPHFLNPEILGRDDREEDYIGEENQDEKSVSASEETAEPQQKTGEPVHMEEVLNQGLGFLSGLLEMATGEKLQPAKESDKLVTIDKESGEVTLKFTLPGFSKKERL